MAAAAAAPLAALAATATVEPFMVETTAGERFVATGRVLGKGSYAQVFEGLSLDDGGARRVALKVLDKGGCRHGAAVATERIQREIDTMVQAQHEHVLQLIGATSNTAADTRVTLVLELAEGGDMLRRVIHGAPYTEHTLRPVFRQLLQGVAALHKRGLAHRDLKCENVMLDADGRVKIGDFGFATECNPGRPLRDFVGSVPYASPEIVTSTPYAGPPADMWSLGVIFFCVLTNRFPFPGTTERAIAIRIERVQYDTPGRLSPLGRDFLAALLTRSPANRLTADAALLHPWITGAVDAVTSATIASFLACSLGDAQPLPPQSVASPVAAAAAAAAAAITSASPDLNEPTPVGHVGSLAASRSTGYEDPLLVASPLPPQQRISRGPQQRLQQNAAAAAVAIARAANHHSHGHHHHHPQPDPRPADSRVLQSPPLLSSPTAAAAAATAAATAATAVAAAAATSSPPSSSSSSSSSPSAPSAIMDMAPLSLSDPARVVSRKKRNSVTIVSSIERSAASFTASTAAAPPIRSTAPAIAPASTLVPSSTPASASSSAGSSVASSVNSAPMSRLASPDLSMAAAGPTAAGRPTSRDRSESVSAAVPRSSSGGGSGFGFGTTLRFRRNSSGSGIVSSRIDAAATPTAAASHRDQAPMRRRNSSSSSSSSGRRRVQQKVQQQQGHQHQSGMPPSTKKAAQAAASPPESPELRAMSPTPMMLSSHAHLQPSAACDDGDYEFDDGDLVSDLDSDSSLPPPSPSPRHHFKRWLSALRFRRVASVTGGGF